MILSEIKTFGRDGAAATGAGGGGATAAGVRIGVGGLTVGAGASAGLDGTAAGPLEAEAEGFETGGVPTPVLGTDGTLVAVPVVKTGGSTTGAELGTETVLAPGIVGGSITKSFLGSDGATGVGGNATESETWGITFFLAFGLSPPVSLETARFGLATGAVAPTTSEEITAFAFFLGAAGSFTDFSSADFLEVDLTAGLTDFFFGSVMGSLFGFGFRRQFNSGFFGF